MFYLTSFQLSKKLVLQMYVYYNIYNKQNVWKFLPTWKLIMLTQVSKNTFLKPLALNWDLFRIIKWNIARLSSFKNRSTYSK